MSETKSDPTTMPDARAVMHSLAEGYAAAVNANDSVAYGKLMAPDAIRVPPGKEPEIGREAIARSEQSDYDVYKFSVKMRLVDAVPIAPDWVFGFAWVDADLTSHEDGSTITLHATKAFLMQRQPSGEWLIYRYTWGLKA